MKRNNVRACLLVASLSAATVVFAAGNVTDERVLTEAATGANWFLKGGNFRGEHYSPLAQITDENVTDL
ncbi:MAG: PQQ-dependent dehydrogenase, methanol/ethanol family, partial [Gammaproteobacteria bacterium]|nr:PQQ-dependent dehydrogenase, methanol/ethanol family [Gammaproteobacteria bacterium]